MGTLRLGPAERARLAAGASTLGLELDTGALDRFEAYAGVLDEWAARTNLISCHDGAELVDRHLLDSLALVRLLADGGRLVDLGSGAGFPGVPLAIVGTAREVVLVESRRRRTSFLRAVKRQLGLDGLEILERRAELGPPPEAAPFDAVTCRAVWRGGAVLGVAAAWLASGGRLFWMRRGAEELACADEAIEPERVVPYRIGTGPERHVHVYRRL